MRFVSLSLAWFYVPIESARVGAVLSLEFPLLLDPGALIAGPGGLALVLGASGFSSDSSG